MDGKWNGSVLGVNDKQMKFLVLTPNKSSFPDCLVQIVRQDISRLVIRSKSIETKYPIRDPSPT